MPILDPKYNRSQIITGFVLFILLLAAYKYWAPLKEFTHSKATMQKEV